jgi:hypothetical protein
MTCLAARPARSSRRLCARTVTLLIFAAGLGAACPAAAATFPPGSQVEGHISSHWAPCVTVGAQRPTGGYLLKCAELPVENVFSESDVRSPGPAQAAVNRPPPAVPTPALPQAVAPAGVPVQGFFAGRWIACTQLGPQLPTGGYRLHCPALPDPENIFSETDVRQIGAPLADPNRQLPAAPQGRRVQGHVDNHWEACTQIGAQLQTGGYLLRCDSALGVESVFSETDVRF